MSQLRTATTPSGTTSIGHVHEQTMISKITTRNNHWISRKGTVDFAQNMVEVDPLSVPSPILNDAVSPMSSNGWMYETLYYNSNSCGSGLGQYISAFQLNTCLPSGSDSRLINNDPCKF